MIERIVKWLEALLYRFNFGRKYGLGLLPTKTQITDHIYAHGTLISKSECTDGAYRIGDKVYSSYQRNEILTRYLYQFDGKEYASLEVRKK